MKPDKQYEFTSRFEGVFSHMYLDSKGLITAGVGFCLPTLSDAQALPFVPKEFIERDYRLIQTLQKGYVAAWYGKFMKAHLSEKDMRDIFYVKCMEFEVGLRRMFPEWDKFPKAAQMGLMDMVYNMGVRKYQVRFPKHRQAVLAQRWDVVAAECHRTDVQEERNVCTFALFQSCDDAPFSNV